MRYRLAKTTAEFYQDNSEAAVIMGPVGSGKTVATCLRLGRHAYEQAPGPDKIRRSRWAIVRNTYPQLTLTTLKTWLEVFPENEYGKFQRTSRTHHWRFQLPDGTTVDAEFIFLALDDEKDKAKLLGAEVTGIWYNEIREINTEILGLATSRVGRYPSAAAGGCTWHGWIGDTNPWAFTSDLHTMFVADRPDGYAFFKQPGGLEPNAENLENLEQTPDTLALPHNDPKRREQGREYYRRLLRGFNKLEGDMYVHCRYGVSRDGKPCFTSYDDNVHSGRRYEVPKGADLWIGYDNTGRSPAAVAATKTDDGQWRVVFEFCGDGMGMKEHAQAFRRALLLRFENPVIRKITCDPAGQAKDSGELDMRMIVQQVFPGVPVVNARTNDIETRIEAVDSGFRALVNGEPKLSIDERCKLLRQACIDKYHYRKMKIAGEERYTEQPEKNLWSNVADALQYLMLGGGEGRLGEASKEVQWPKDGKAITPQTPTRAGAPVNPFTGRRDGWNPLGFQG